MGLGLAYEGRVRGAVQAVGRLRQVEPDVADGVVRPWGQFPPFVVVALAKVLVRPIGLGHIERDRLTSWGPEGEGSCSLPTVTG